MCVCVFVFLRVRVCVFACVRAHVCVQPQSNADAQILCLLSLSLAHAHLTPHAGGSRVMDGPRRQTDDRGRPRSRHRRTILRQRPPALLTIHNVTFPGSGHVRFARCRCWGRWRRGGVRREVGRRHGRRRRRKRRRGRGQLASATSADRRRCVCVDVSRHELFATHELSAGCCYF